MSIRKFIPFMAMVAVLAAIIALPALANTHIGQTATHAPPIVSNTNAENGYYIEMMGTSSTENACGTFAWASTFGEPAAAIMGTCIDQAIKPPGDVDLIESKIAMKSDYTMDATMACSTARNENGEPQLASSRTPFPWTHSLLATSVAHSNRCAGNWARQNT